MYGILIIKVAAVYWIRCNSLAASGVRLRSIDLLEVDWMRLLDRETRMTYEAGKKE